VSSHRRSHAPLVGFAALCCLSFAVLVPSRASAITENPAWTVNVVAAPTNFAPGDHTGDDYYKVIVTNTGDAPSNDEPVTIADALPPGLALAAPGVSGSELLRGYVWPRKVLGEETLLSCSGLACTYSGVVAAGDTLTLMIPVDVEAESESSVTNVVTVSGGGVAEASASAPTGISSAAPGFGIAPGSFSLGVSNAQAGAHGDVSTSFFLDENAAGSTGGKLKETVVEPPPGFAGDPLTTPLCSEAQLDETTGFKTECPPEAQVGTITVYLGETNCGVSPSCTTTVVAPVYDIRPLGGEVARLGFDVATISSNIVFTIAPGTYRLRASVPSIVSGTLQVQGSVLTLWGVPEDPSHNLMRGTVCIDGGCTGPTEEAVGKGVPAKDPPEPFASSPTGCEGPSSAIISLDTWQHREEYQHAESSFGPLTGCERLGFNPSLLVQPTSTQAETPTGLDIGLTLPQTYESPVALATSNLKNVTVTLPEGVTVNPSAGEGLGACTPAQYAAEALETPAGEGCPNDSSLGTVTIHTPVLKEEATGSVYLATPYDNPFPEEGHPGGSLLALYVVARIKDRGVLVKVAGKVTPNPVTGQLVTTFENNPQLPFDTFTLSFRPGEAAPLVTPPACGEYTARSEFTSWSEPEQILSGLSTPFGIAQGVGGGECPSGGVPPFNPQAISGTLDNDAGSYSPFYLRIVRNDGEQEITRFSTVLPPGLTGNLTGIPFCPEADIEAARGVSGTEELEHPSCPTASEIGHTLVGAGVGGVLAQAPGKVYLAGPYHGAPLSIVSITSAKVGPFDLGTVVIRFALEINPLTAQVEVSAADSEAIPHIIRGIVVHVRDIRVYVNRPNFIVNPTSCNPLTLSTTITGGGADPTNPADADPVTVTHRAQAADCSSLAFKPSLKVSTSGRTSRANGASLTFKLTYPTTPQGSEANLARFKVELPKQLPSRLKTLQKACLAKTFEANPASCPATSIVGYAKTITPIVPVPLEGPAYFVSHGGEAFPSLIVVLQGYGLTIDVVSTTFINKHGITSGTVKTVPDVPFNSFQLTLPEGPHSALAAPHSLCKAKLAMPTEFLAQNGALIDQNIKIAVTGCPKTRTAHKARRKGKALR
jgi:uncharacterized repeat protein (TIGR01451 family)